MGTGINTRLVRRHAGVDGNGRCVEKIVLRDCELA